MPNDGSDSETDRRPKLCAQAEERCSVCKLKTRTKELLALAFWNSSQEKWTRGQEDDTLRPMVIGALADDDERHNSMNCRNYSM